MVTLWSIHADLINQIPIRTEYHRRTCSFCRWFACAGADGGDDERSRTVCELHHADADSTSTTLHQHGASLHRSRYVDRPVSG